MSVQNSTSEMSEQARANPNDIPLAETFNTLIATMTYFLRSLRS